MKGIRKHLLTALLLLSSNFIFISPANASTIYTFSNATATGKNGPTQAQINAAYSGTNLAGIVTVTASGIQKFTIPTTGNYVFEIAGAKGGNTSSFIGGPGAIFTTNSVSLSQGEVIQIGVGQIGIISTDNTGAGGGGASWVFRESNSTLVAISGGGGGAGPNATGAGSTAQNSSVGSGQGGYSGATQQSNGGTSGNGGINTTNICGLGGAGWLGDGLASATCARTGSASAIRINSTAIGGTPDTGSGANAVGGFGGGGAGAGNCGYGGGGGGYSGGGGGSYASTCGGSGGAGGSFSNAGFNWVGTNAAVGYVKATLAVPDTTAPTFTSSSSFSVSENISTSATAATIRISESATVTISSGADAARFNISRSDTDTAIIKFNVSPDFEAPADVGGNNVYDITLTATDAAANAGTQSITITVTDVVDTSGFNSLALAGSATTASYRTVIVITANITVASKVTFRVNGKILPGCKNRSTTGSSPNIIATCSWKPSIRGAVSLTAVATPTGAGISSSTSSPLSIMVGSRVGSR